MSLEYQLRNKGTEDLNLRHGILRYLMLLVTQTKCIFFKDPYVIINLP